MLFRRPLIARVPVVVLAVVVPSWCAAAWTLDTPLSQASASFLGETDQDCLGWPVSEAGDVNGDGYDDFLIGAYANSEGGEHAGQTYLVLGKPTGWAMDTSVVDSDASFVGTTSWDYVGIDLSSAGDVNGDGLGDFLIGAPFDDEAGGSEVDCCDGAGQVYLVLGRVSGWVMDTPVTALDASFLGEAAHNYTGEWLSGGGDVNGDGFDDFLIGAPTNDEGIDNGGQVYLILGRAAGWQMDTPLWLADASFLGIQDGDQVAKSAIAGDIDGDGLDDVLIQSRFDNYGHPSGMLSIFFGQSTAWSSDTPLSDADASLVGDVDSGPGAIASGGDLNGDGFGDILVGASSDDGAAHDAGRACVVFGEATGGGIDVPLASATCVLQGEAANDQLGLGVDMAGDFNADGLTDLLVSTWYNDENGTDAGQVYVLHATPVTDIEDPTAALASSFLGEMAGDRAGMGLSRAGDVNGDGADDFLVGAPWNDEAGSDAGQVYLILSDACPDDDGDEYSTCEDDCDDGDPAVNPGVAEDCSDEIDNDCDGLVDEQDPDCESGDDDTTEDPTEEPDDDDAWDEPGEQDDEESGDCACSAAQGRATSVVFVSGLFAIGLLTRRRRSFRNPS